MVMRLVNAVVGDRRKELVRRGRTGSGAAAHETAIGAASVAATAVAAAGFQSRQFLTQFCQFSAETRRKKKLIENKVIIN